MQRWKGGETGVGSQVSGLRRVVENQVSGVGYQVSGVG